MKFIKQFNLFETWHPTGKEWYNYLLKDDIIKYETSYNQINAFGEQELLGEKEINKISELFLEKSGVDPNRVIQYWHPTEKGWINIKPQSTKWIRIVNQFDNPSGHHPPTTKFTLTIRKLEDEWYVVDLMGGYKVYICDQLDQLLDLLSKLFRVTSNYIEDIEPSS